jgi:hypothetical protein
VARFGFAAAGFLQTERHAAHFPERERSGVGLVAPQGRVITAPTIITLACVAGQVTDE